MWAEWSTVKNFFWNFFSFKHLELVTLDSDTRFVQVVKKRTTPKRRTLLHMGRKETLTHKCVLTLSLGNVFFDTWSNKNTSKR